MIQPPPCEKHELNELGCVECTVKRTVFYESAIPDDVLYYGDDPEWELPIYAVGDDT